MKSTCFILLTAALTFSCNTKQPEKRVAVAADTATTIVTRDTVTASSDTHYFWSADLQPGRGLVMTRLRPAAADSLTAAYIIQMLNDTYPDIPLRLAKISHDSIFVKIPKSDYLTEQMGSTGAQAYLAEVTYNLTELKDIRFVVFSFKAGDHASPDTYTRTDFIRTWNR